MCSPSRAEMEREAERLRQWQPAQHQLVPVSPGVSTRAGRGGRGGGVRAGGEGKQKSEVLEV